MKVEDWFETHKFSYKSYSRISKLVNLKNKRNLVISVCIPTLNEGNTIGKIVSTIKSNLMDKHRLVDEIIVIDSGSTDKTKEEAEKAGAKFYSSQNILKSQGNYKGKGENVWKSLYVSRGDILAILDGDIKNIHPRFVYGVLGPLLANKKIKYVNSFFRRPFLKGTFFSESGGGRVTELLVRPMLNKFFPSLKGFIQPLGGAYAVKRTVLEKIPIFSSYCGDIVLPIDIRRMFGLSIMSQVDLGRIIHDHQSLSSLSNNSFYVLNAILKRANECGKLILIKDTKKYSLVTSKKINGSRKYFCRKRKYFEKERPPMITIPQYRKRFKNGK